MTNHDTLYKLILILGAFEQLILVAGAATVWLVCGRRANRSKVDRLRSPNAKG